jgi:2-dehydro-3-deoxyphosphogluconate aldolase/(4S)-4-hydroxy-2-oxoglutarate aldolase
MVKVFPGDVLTPAFVKSLRGPFPEARCVVSGGVSLDNIGLWFKAGTTAVGIGSDLTGGTEQEIELKARQYVLKARAS